MACDARGTPFQVPPVVGDVTLICDRRHEPATNPAPPMTLSDFELVNVGHRRAVGTLEVVAPAVPVTVSASPATKAMVWSRAAKVRASLALRNRIVADASRYAFAGEISVSTTAFSLHLGTSALRAHAATWIRRSVHSVRRCGQRVLGRVTNRAVRTRCRCARRRARRVRAGRMPSADVGVKEHPAVVHGDGCHAIFGGESG